jgi:hypothetical protein
MPQGALRQLARSDRVQRPNGSLGGAAEPGPLGHQHRGNVEQFLVALEALVKGEQSTDELAVDMVQVV